MTPDARASLTKSRRLLTARDLDAASPVFNDGNPDRPPSITLSFSADEFAEYGSPETIAVTVEPVDNLNPAPRPEMWQAGDQVAQTYTRDEQGRWWRPDVPLSQPDRWITDRVDEGAFTVSHPSPHDRVTTCGEVALTSDGQANTCPHGSATGVDQEPIGPDKIWRCDHCGLTWTDVGTGLAASQDSLNGAQAKIESLRAELAEVEDACKWWIDFCAEVTAERDAARADLSAGRAVALGDAIYAVHIRRFDHDHGKVGGPDSFYAGVRAARRALYDLLPEGATDPLGTTGAAAPAAARTAGDGS